MPRASGTLVARSVSKSYGEMLVLDRVSLAVAPGSRVGIVGPNGIGKTTLLRILAGIEAADQGSVALEPASATVAYLAQDARVATCSGGEAARTKLEAVISEGADVVLLDEPTNDLDFAGIELLERFVESHHGGLVAVSHDRVFLELMTRIIEFDAETRRTREFAGGWSAFDAERRLARERHKAAYRRAAAERRRVEEQARRMREWEQRGYGQGRKKKKTKDVRRTFERKLSRVEQVEKPWAPWRLELELSPGRRSGAVVARLERIVVDRGTFRLGPLDFELGQGERLALTGRNGVGKTTLLHALLGELPIASGRRWVGPSTVFGELPQGAGLFSERAPLLEAFTGRSGLSPRDARTLLAKFALGTEDARRPGGSLSPGERSRAMLALLAARGVNTLVLDEPTNHLDLEAIEQLEAALDGFVGTIVLVTHDRRFLESFGATRTIDLGKAQGRAAGRDAVR